MATLVIKKARDGNILGSIDGYITTNGVMMVPVKEVASILNATYITYADYIRINRDGQYTYIYYNSKRFRAYNTNFYDTLDADGYAREETVLVNGEPYADVRYLVNFLGVDPSTSYQKWDASTQTFTVYDWQYGKTRLVAGPWLNNYSTLLTTFRLATNFLLGEQKCNDNHAGSNGCNGAVHATLDQFNHLQQLRNLVGALKITDGFRCMAENDATPNSAPKSYHQMGDATDIVPLDTTQCICWYHVINDVWPDHGGRKAYATGHIHVDCRQGVPWCEQEVCAEYPCP